MSNSGKCKLLTADQYIKKCKRDLGSFSLWVRISTIHFADDTDEKISSAMKEEVEGLKEEVEEFSFYE